MLLPKLRFLTLGALMASNLSFATAEEAESAIRIGRAAETQEGPVIDGMVDEEVWEQADVFTDFTQAEPHQGQPATEKTEVKVLFDGQAIYIGVICYDSEPDRIVVNDTRRDSDLAEMDGFKVVLDTYHDKQNGFVFGTNPAGLEYDGQVTNDGQAGRMGGGRQMAGSGGRLQLELGRELARSGKNP